eukprot:scaffold15802_cov48-Phaeocystis_antarctica.AAC.1
MATPHHEVHAHHTPPPGAQPSAPDHPTSSLAERSATHQRHATWPTGPRPHRRSATLHSRLTAACVPTTECKP